MLKLYQSGQLSTADAQSFISGRFYESESTNSVSALLVPTLEAILNKNDISVEQKQDYLRRALKNPHPEVRTLAIKNLGYLASEEQNASLSDVIKASATSRGNDLLPARAALCQAIRGTTRSEYVETPMAPEVLAAALASSNPVVRRIAEETARRYTVSTYWKPLLSAQLDTESDPANHLRLLQFSNGAMSDVECE